MKLSALFARYLYQRKRLELPGIGIFSIDASATVPDPSDKMFPDFLQQIKYEQKPVQAATEDLINFIRTETGKIKPLAESDLDSFLSDGKILLNIGKPFHIEGIGSLMKTKSGVFEFTPGEPFLQKLEGFYSEAKEDGVKKKSAFTDDQAQAGDSRKLLIGLGLICGLALVIWGGYSLYNRNTLPEKKETATQVDTATAPAHADSSKANVILDSVKKIIDSTSLPKTSTAGTYRFIIERTANKTRALKRYQQLKDNLTDIKMESADSTLFSLYFLLPANPSDTARIRDSLKTWYARKQVFVEPN